MHRKRCVRQENLHPSTEQKAQEQLQSMAAYYRLSVKMLGRSSGQAVVASAAYRAGELLRDERYGKTYDYSPRRGILDKGILTPENAPEWARDREQLWNQVEAAEKRKDAQLARELELALPHQLSREERVTLVETFIREQLLPLGMIVDYAIHAPNRAGDQRNWHAHLLTTLRPVKDGELSSHKDREACKPEMIARWRAAWAEIQNRTYERLRIQDLEGAMLRADHRSYADQGLDREPTQHMGVHAAAMERRGERTEIGDRNRRITARNDAMVSRTLSRDTWERPSSSRQTESDLERPGRYRPRETSRDDRDEREP